MVTIEERMAELERRVLAGEDDKAYCLRWISHYAKLLEARDRKISG